MDANLLMKQRLLVLGSACIVLFGSVSFVRAASVFPDVAEDNLFRESIEELVRAQVISGNPDGTFRPNDNVNRAAMLKMLYLAQGKKPDALSVRCFPDVAIDSWYEPFVCDAAARRYVKGYTDGMFRPDSPVNRVEALKMIMMVFDIPLEEINDSNREIVNFGDVSVAAWYTTYLLTAYDTNILPFPGQEGGRFFPDRPLTRGEAAAIIYNALHADFIADREQQAQSSSSTVSSVIIQEEEEGGNAASSSASEAAMIDKPFPFQHDGKFNKKLTASFRFEVATAQTVSIVANLQPGQTGQLTCRLYLLNASGFSDQYFLGYMEDASCHITASLNPGSYQLQLQPTNADTTYSVSAAKAIGDGNDGFYDARPLSLNAERTDVLGAKDMEDWYSFTLISQQKMTVTLENPAELRCIVYAMNDVNLASFAGPQCNTIYTYPPGTYFVSVGRKAPLAAQQTYKVNLKK